MFIARQIRVLPLARYSGEIVPFREMVTWEVHVVKKFQSSLINSAPNFSIACLILHSFTHPRLHSPIAAFIHLCSGLMISEGSSHQVRVPLTAFFTGVCRMRACTLASYYFTIITKQCICLKDTP
jgi:hypothetical protein